MKAERATAASLPDDAKAAGCTIAAATNGERRAFLLAAACAVAVVVAPTIARAQAGKPLSIDALMVLLAQRGSGQARFIEERTVAGFEGPLRSSGLLSFTAPDRFSRETLEPRRERMEVAGNQIRLERGGRVRVLTLDAVPELVALVEGLRGTLSGNAALLRKHFELRLEGQARLWTLTLQPLKPEGLYALRPEAGVIEAASDEAGVPGAVLAALQVALARSQLDALQQTCALALPALKAQLRALLHYHLGSTPLRTRQVMHDLRTL